jgi:hypothetical protein
MTLPMAPRTRWSHVCRLSFAAVLLLTLNASLSGAAAADAEPLQRLFAGLNHALVPTCLTPDVGSAMSNVVATGALQPVLGEDFTLVRGDIRDNQIELEIEDRAHQSYAVTLALQGARTEPADGHGRNFQFYLAPSTSPPNPRATAVLLGVAAQFDQGIPDTALAPCGGGDEDRGVGGRAMGDGRYPRVLFLASAVAEVLIVVAAILFALRTIPTLNGTTDLER